jgi:hypothetical protein
LFETNLCNTNYYKNAIQYISDRVENPVFYIFSDDLAWCRETFSDTNCVYVEGNGGIKSSWDMYLMSCCDHNIIANSTFSWWGAWLNANEDKMVLCPDTWLPTGTYTDVVPDRWIKISG